MSDALSAASRELTSTLSVGSVSSSGRREEEEEEEEEEEVEEKGREEEEEEGEGEGEEEEGGGIKPQATLQFEYKRHTCPPIVE